MKIVTLALSAFGLAGLTAGQNGNDPLILNNRTAISVPVTPSPVRSNKFLPKPSTSVECWRDGYPCSQNGGQRSQCLVADFVEPTPAIAARVPLPEFFSTRPAVPDPFETKVPGEMSLDTLAPVSEPTGESSMGILPIPVFLGGEPPKQHPPPTGEAIVSVLPVTSSVPGSDNSPIITSAPHDPHSTWPSHWRGATSEVAAAPTQTADCNLHFCPTGTVNSTSTPPSTPLPTIPGPVEPSVTKPVVSTSSHLAIPPEPNSSIIDTYTKASTPCTTTAELTPLPISTVSGIIQDPLMTPAPATSTVASISTPEDMQVLLVYCGTDKCVPVKMSDLTSCHGTPTPRSGPAVAPEVTSPPSVAAPVPREPITVTIDCNHHYCYSGMETVYTITPTPYTYPIVSATSGVAIPPEVNKAFVPIEWWRGPNESIVPEAPKSLKGGHGPVKRHSSFVPVSSVATDSPCYRHYCPSGYTPKPPPTTMVTTSKPAQPAESASLHSSAVPPSFETFTA